METGTTDGLGRSWAAGSGRHCSLGDSRSWTDLYTNVTSLSPVTLRDDLTSLMGLGTTPPAYLPAFVHELAHHWCFKSPVGSTMAMLEMRARRLAVLWQRGESVDAHQIFADVTRYETAAALLRPLAEGIALFAEFDAVSGPESTVLSEVGLQVGALFSGGADAIRYQGIYLPLEGTRAPLIEWRATPACLDRKQRVMSHPFDYASGYLPGYLAVRRLWLQAATGVPWLLKESDLFMAYLRAYVYEDLGLVELLLRDDLPSLETSVELCRYLFRRIQAVADVTEEQVRAFEREVAELPPGGAVWSVQNEPADAEQVVHRLNQMADDLGASAAERTPAGSLAAMDMAVLGQRDIVHFGSAVATVHVKGGHCSVVLDGDELRAGPALPTAAPGEGAGSVELCCSLQIQTRARALIVRRRDEIVAVLVAGTQERNADTIKRFASSLSPVELEDYRQRTGAALRDFLATDGIDDLVAEMRQVLPDFTETIYGPLALNSSDSERRESLAKLMRQTGLLPLLDYDRPTVYALAAISVGWSLRHRRHHLDARLKPYRTSLDVALNRLRKAEAAYGLPAIAEGADLLWSSV